MDGRPLNECMLAVLDGRESAGLVFPARENNLSLLQARCRSLHRSSTGICGIEKS